MCRSRLMSYNYKITYNAAFVIFFSFLYSSRLHAMKDPNDETEELDFTHWQKTYEKQRHTQMRRK